MKIGGIHKFSLIDYPGKIACTIFTLGCNFRCSFCHNAQLVLPDKFNPPLSLSEVTRFLEKRNKQIEGVVISGGEPLIQKNLYDFLAYIKDFGLPIKLDTNGSLPKQLKHFIDEGLINYVAMDIKNVFSKYSTTCGVAVDTDNIAKSIDIIKNSGLPHHFRTTFYDNDITKKDLETIKKEIVPSGSEYKIQDFKESGYMIKNFTV